MNKDRILELANNIERLELGLNFDMEYYYSEHGDVCGPHKCGTSACIAGWTIVLFEPASLDYVDMVGSYDRKAEEILDLPPDAWEPLFHNYEYAQDNERAAQVLRKLAVTGTVDWDTPWDIPCDNVNGNKGEISHE